MSFKIGDTVKIKYEEGKGRMFVHKGIITGPYSTVAHDKRFYYVGKRVDQDKTTIPVAPEELISPARIVLTEKYRQTYR